jgi:hypothetical protein
VLVRARSHHWSPLHVTAVTAALVALWLAFSPVDDHDAFWHVQIGREILQKHTLYGLGRSWLGASAPSWVTSQWLSEVLMAGAVDTWGWRALIVARLLVMVAIVGVVAATLLRPRPTPTSTVIASVVFVALATSVQDRPQTLSLFFLALLAFACHRLLIRRGRPPLAAIGCGCLLWAQLHGLWILAPVAFTLVSAGLAIEDRSIRSRDVQAALTCLLASLIGVVNPHGMMSLLLPWRFHQATGAISEWMPTTIGGVATVGWALLVTVTVLGWARSPASIRASEILWVVAWTAFGTQAYRNVIPAMLLTAPMTITALHRTWPPRHSTATPLESRVLAALTVAVLIVGGLFLTAKVASVTPLHDVRAMALARWVARQAQPVRIFNDYNASGTLVQFSGGKARLVVDGRADMWGDRYIRTIVGTTELHRGWEGRLNAFHPDAIVTRDDAPLRQLLVHEGTWRVAVRDRHYELLLPASTG